MGPELPVWGRELGIYSAGIPPSRMVGGDFLCDVAAKARPELKPSPPPQMTLNRSGHHSNALGLYL